VLKRPKPVLDSNNRFNPLPIICWFGAGDIAYWSCPTLSNNEHYALVVVVGFSTPSKIWLMEEVT
jgi:hypothetical protein